MSRVAPGVSTTAALSFAVSPSMVRNELGTMRRSAVQGRRAGARGAVAQPAVADRVDLVRPDDDQLVGTSAPVPRVAGLRRGRGGLGRALGGLRGRLLPRLLLLAGRLGGVLRGLGLLLRGLARGVLLLLGRVACRGAVLGGLLSPPPQRRRAGPRRCRRRRCHRRPRRRDAATGTRTGTAARPSRSHRQCRPTAAGTGAGAGAAARVRATARTGAAVRACGPGT